MRKQARIERTCLECGTSFEALRRVVEIGQAKFCSRNCANRAAARTHGHAFRGNGTRTYNTWANMKQRCKNPKATKFPAYGAKGILVCERWLVFENFLADMGERPEGKTLDRLDSNGNYEPGNCCWATPMEQQSHISRANIVRYRGEEMRITYAARELGISAKLLDFRVKMGWPEDHWGLPPGIRRKGKCR